MIGFGCWFFFLFFPLFNKDDYTEDLGADYYNLGRLKRIYLCVKAGFHLKAVLMSLNIFGHFGITLRKIWNVEDLMDLENWNLKWRISRRTPNSPLPTRSPIFEGVGRSVQRRRWSQTGNDPHTGNDPRPQMIPRPEMITELDRKWSRTANDPRSGPQMIPPENEEWHGVCSYGNK